MTDHEAPDPRRIAADLGSGQPERIAAGLASLDLADRFRRFVPVPPPDLESLTAFGDSVPEETLTRFLNVWQNYPLFEPAPDPSEIHRTLVEAVLRYAGEQPIFQVALALRTDDIAPYAVRDVMRYLKDRDFSTSAELDRADQLLTHLLDSENTHGAVVEGLAFLALVGRHPELVERLLPQLNSGERARIQQAQE